MSDYIKTEQEFRDKVSLFNTDIAVTTVYESNSVLAIPSIAQNVDMHVRLVHKSKTAELEAEVGDILIIAPMNLINLDLNDNWLNVYLVDQNMVLGYIKGSKVDYKTLAELEYEMENPEKAPKSKRKKLRFLSNMTPKEIRKDFTLLHTNMIVESVYEKGELYQEENVEFISAVGRVIHRGESVAKVIRVNDNVYLNRVEIQKFPLHIKGTAYRFVGSHTAVGRVTGSYESMDERRVRFGDKVVEAAAKEKTKSYAAKTIVFPTASELAGIRNNKR